MNTKQNHLWRDILVLAFFIFVCFGIWLLFLKDDKFENCVEAAQKNYDRQWNFQCTNNEKEEGCSLNGDTASRLNKKLVEDKLVCQKLYQ